ncbi:MAG: pancreas/duodenum homeobox protein 1 [Desulfobulbaceae bacterium]|nr:pancreas/duodenum homeobox protein 1 [Desulfobulbaceae bacterium]
MTKNLAEIFTPEVLQQLFPKARSDEFFEALFGDASEGAYDICLEFVGNPNLQTYQFELHLKQRPGKCLACNLTYGLPEVFSRHPGLNIKGLAAELASKLGLDPEQISWSLGVTKSISSALHVIPFLITVE